MAYKWTIGGPKPKIPANAFGHVLEEIAEGTDFSSVSAKAIVDRARPPSSPIHRAFQWNDRKAAEQNRPICYSRPAGEKIEEPTFKWGTHQKVTMTERERIPKDVSDRLVCADRLAEALRCIDGRWKMPILAHLSENETTRFSDLKEAIPQGSQKIVPSDSNPEYQAASLITNRIRP